MKTLIAFIVAAFATTATAAPLCLRLDTSEMVPCYSDAKIEAAMKILRRRGIQADRDYVISIEENRGKFKNAADLARYISGE